MSVSMVLVLAFLIGVVCGLRSMTAPAVVCWAVHLGWLNLAGTHLAWVANPIVLGIFTVAAAGELIADKTAKIPARTTAVPFAARLILGAMCGGIVAVAGTGSFGWGFVLGAVGGLAGTFGGYHARRAATREGRLPDFPVALFEDLIAVGGGLFLVSRF